MAYSLRTSTPVPTTYSNTEEVEHFILRPRCNSIELGRLRSSSNVEYVHLPSINEDSKSLRKTRRFSDDSSGEPGILLTSSVDRAAFQRLRAASSLGCSKSVQTFKNMDGIANDTAILKGLQNMTFKGGDGNYESDFKEVGKVPRLKRTQINETNSLNSNLDNNLSKHTSNLESTQISNRRLSEGIRIEHSRTRSFPAYEFSLRPRKPDKPPLRHSRSAPDAKGLLRGWCNENKDDVCTAVNTMVGESTEEALAFSNTKLALKNHVEHEAQNYDANQSKTFIFQKWKESQSVDDI